jgi:shikimate dehydrogenase
MTEKKTLFAGVVGDPITHSLSPALHGYWLKKYKINGDYSAFHVPADKLPEFIANLKENNLRGVNLTVPHKENALDLVDRVEPEAQKIGAINTVYFDREGKLIGTNTDGYGFLKHLKQTIPDWRSPNKIGVVLGAGGAARAVIVSLLEDGISEIRLCNRTILRAENLADDIADKRIKVTRWEDREDALCDANLVVNVTTLGMTGQRPLDIDLEKLPIDAVVYDIVYNPIETDLLKNAKSRGNRTVDGLGMLLHQAAPGFEKWFGKIPEVDAALAHYLLGKLK